MSERDDRPEKAPETEHDVDVRALAEEAAHAVAHPIETAKELEHEAEVGESARTPLIVLSGVTIFVGIVVVILLAIALTLYFVYGGK